MNCALRNSATVILLLTLIVPAFSAEMESEEFAEALRDAVGAMAQQKGFGFDFPGGEVLILRAGPEDPPQQEKDGTLRSYRSWLNPQRELVIYAKPHLKADVNAFTDEATRQNIPWRRIAKPHSQDLLIAVGPGGKATEVVVAFCLAHTPILPSAP